MGNPFISGLTMWDRFIPTYLPIYISYIHVHMLHNADLPTFPGFPLVAENLHDNVVALLRACVEKSGTTGVLD